MIWKGAERINTLFIPLSFHFSFLNDEDVTAEYYLPGTDCNSSISGKRMRRCLTRALGSGPRGRGV